MEPSDPFDPAKLRLNQAAQPSFGAKKHLTTVPVKKPNRQSFVRVHPSEDYRLTAAIIEMKDDHEIYLVARELHDVLADEVTLATLFTAVDRQGNVFLWYIKLPKDGRSSDWHESALSAAKLATTRWVRVVANMSLGAYDVFTASAQLPEPEWPSHDLRSLLRIAFRDRYIDSDDHPIIAKLQGRV
jgi:hypothetical protein